MGQLALPDIQRPFVWKNAKVRDLFDSLYRGYPVGNFLFWMTGAAEEAKGIGTNTKQLNASLLIVDGQQRLTGLFAVVRGVSVIRDDFAEESITIAFSPLDGTFAVADAATRNDPRYLPSISVVWASGADLFGIANDFVERLRAARRAAGEELLPDEVQRAQKALTALANLLSFPFTALVLNPSISEEQVSEVFVRINSKGKPLNQSDFILTLMSVFWDDGRKQLEAFSRSAKEPGSKALSAFNLTFQPAPDQLLRVAIGYGFLRARLQYAYSLLRGKDLETGEFSPAQREAQFAILKGAQALVLENQNWHDFLSLLPLAGLRGKNQVSSENALVMAYTLFLLGRHRYTVSLFELKTVIAQWYFMSSLTARYTGGSAESAMESDLAALRSLTGGQEFLQWMQGNIKVELTNDFWHITLPSRLRTSASRGPALFGYYAALVIQDARVLYSRKKVADLLDPARKSKRQAVERHHLFPKKYLKKRGLAAGNKEMNRIANLALVEWDDNAQIGEQGPVEYAEAYANRFTGKELAQMHYWHGLPSGWHTMSYPEFLAERERLLARVVKDGYYAIGGTAYSQEAEATAQRPTLQVLLEAGEGSKVEFKSTLRRNLVTGQNDVKMESSVLRTLAGFMNAEGGQLLVGVSDGGEVLGTAEDGFESEDRMTLHLVNLVKARLGAHNLAHVDVAYERMAGKTVLIVSCRAAQKPVFLTDGSFDRFYVRTLAATTELMGSHAQHYIDGRF